MDCKLYCMAISAFSVVFLFYLFLLVAFSSETLYIKIHHRASSAVALFISTIIYGGIFAYLYYDQFINIDRKESLKKWLQQRQQIHEMREVDRRSRLSQMNRN